MKRTLQDIEQDIERFRFELAEELGVIETADSGKKSRVKVLSYRQPSHKHLSSEKEQRP